MFRYSLLRTVLDPILAISGDRGLVRLEFLPRAYQYHTHAHAVARTFDPDAEVEEDSDPFTTLRRELASYFTGEQTRFSVPIDLHGSDFQLRVWNAS